MNESVPVPNSEGRRRPENLESFEFGESTLASRSHPNRNEDAHSIIPELGFAAVCDGMGGHNSGDKASRKAVDALAVERRLWGDVSNQGPDMLERRLRALVSSADKAVREIADGSDSPPGTTVALVQLHEFSDGRKVAYIANLGNSRVYIFRGLSGELEQVSTDDDILNDPFSRQQWAEFYHYELRDSDVARIKKLLDNSERLEDFKEGFERHMFASRNVVTAALGSGMGRASPHVRAVPIYAGDKIMLVSAGIAHKLKYETIKDEAARERSAQQLCEACVRIAREKADAGISARSRHDDMTAVAILVK